MTEVTKDSYPALVGETERTYEVHVTVTQSYLVSVRVDSDEVDDPTDDSEWEAVAESLVYDEAVSENLEYAEHIEILADHGPEDADITDVTRSD